MEGRPAARRRLTAALCALALVQAARAGEDRGLPYPPSRIITAIHWNFSGARPLRKAHGSDLWPCTWALDDALYCAWGDGGGFDGNDDHIGRVSLGFARVTGTPRLHDPASYRGKNVWGAPPYAERPASFGGKVGSLIAVDGVLYGTGFLWTQQNTKEPVAKGDSGPLVRLIWSFDLGKTWEIAPWEPWPSGDDLGTFLDFGRDRANAPGGFVYDYYTRPRDPSHAYLKRILASDLRRAPQASRAYQFLEFVSRSGDAVSWSPREQDAVPVFTDRKNVMGAAVVYDAGLARYLMTVGHFPSGEPSGAATGQLGVFEAPHPWGPWATIYYSDTWGRFGPATRGDYLGLTFPSKWISGDGRALWGVFSGPDGLDAFNLVRAHLTVRAGANMPYGGAAALPHHPAAPHHRAAPFRPAVLRDRTPDLLKCVSHFNEVNDSVFMSCRG